MSKYSESGCRLSLDDAAKKIAWYDDMSSFDVQVRSWADHDVSGYNSICDEIRKEIVGVFDANIVGGDLYDVDLEVGLKLYELLSPEDSRADFNLIDANDDDFWRYLSVVVMPDLTYIRYPNQNPSGDFDVYGILEDRIPGLKYSGSREPEKGSVNIRKKRFYLKPRRIWLKTLWWYIFLSWQGGEKETREVLKDNGSDIIGQLVERTGRRGYRTELYRALMKRYSEEKNKSAKKFSALAKLNLAQCIVIEPCLVDVKNGEKTYVDSLFDIIDNNT